VCGKFNITASSHVTLTGTIEAERESFRCWSLLQPYGEQADEEPGEVGRHVRGVSGDRQTASQQAT